MRKLDTLLLAAKYKRSIKKERKIEEVFERMTLEQLEEITADNTTNDRIKEILASVDGLWILEEG